MFFLLLFFFFAQRGGVINDKMPSEAPFERVRWMGDPGRFVF